MRTVTARIDLSAALCGARDQGMRPTCLAFAVSDAHSCALGTTERLSPEYAFYHAVRHAGFPDSRHGTTLGAMCSAVELDGQPNESHYPYNIHLPSTSALPIPPTPFSHPTYRRSFRQTFGATADIAEFLKNELAPIAVLRISSAFHFVSGPHFTIEPSATEYDVGLHAVVAVGYGVDQSQRSYIKIRNSWGDSWGDGGHAWVRQDYLDSRLSALAVANP